MYRILFVDDEPLIREGVCENVKWGELGYELAGVCENGREACEFLKSHQVDVVMTDICMPFMDGMELSALIRKEYPRIKVLILSGYDDFEYAKKAIKYGVEEYLLKPITSYEMGEVLTELKAKMDKERQHMEKQEEVSSTYRKGQLLLYSEALLHTITGTKTEEECRREREAVGIVLPDGWYMAGVVGLCIYMGHYELNEERRKESALMAFIVYNVSSELMKKYQMGEACQGKDYRVFLLFAAQKSEETEKRILAVCNEIIETVHQMMGLTVNVALGSWQQELKSLYRSYEDAENALLMQYTAGENCVIDSKDQLFARDLRPQFDKITDNCTRHVREHALNKIDDDIREFSQYLCTSGYKRQAAVEVILTVKVKTDRLLMTLGFEKEVGKDVEEEIRKAPLMTEALTVLTAFLKEAAECLDRLGGSGLKSCAYQAYEYIGQHYADSDLSLQEVCNYLGVSTSRFSNIFKQTFGATFVDVVTNVRMEKAKELLAVSDLKNYEIAEKVGFSDPHYFSIAFKKATGKTPTQYAKERNGK